MTYSAEYHRAYYQKNKDRINERSAAWAKANPERVKANNKNKVRDLAKQRIAGAKWEALNPEAVLWRAAKNRAVRDGLSFSIDVADVVIPEVCPLLEMALTPRKGGHGPADSSPSLDRIDNSKGYVKGNVWVISCLANRMKTSASNEQLLMFCKNVPHHFG